MVVGYRAGVFDLFHIGHLNLLRNARSMCDKLIVGVSTDELVVTYKSRTPVIPFAERIEIVRSIKYVDDVVAQQDMNKLGMWQKLRFELMFVGDDWQNTDKWRQYEQQFSQVGVRIVYLPYTHGSSSTLLQEVMKAYRSNDREKPTSSRNRRSELGYLSQRLDVSYEWCGHAGL